MKREKKDPITTQDAKVLRSLATINRDVAKLAISDEELVRREKARKEKRRTAKKEAIIEQDIKKLLNATTDRVKDNYQMIDLLPDLKLIMGYMVASILSPKDLMRTELTYRCEHDNEKVVAQVNEVITDYFDNKVKIRSQLASMLQDSLFYHGAYVTAVLPEGALKKLGVELEEKQKAAKTEYAGLESYYRAVDDVQHLFAASKEKYSFFDTTSDFRLLGVPDLAKDMHAKNEMTRAAVAVGMENARMLVLSGDSASFDKNDSGALEIRLDMASVIPIHPSGSPDEHLGYYIVLDKNNRLISPSADTYHVASSIKNNLNTALNDAESAISLAFKGIHHEKTGVDNKLPSIENFTKIFDEQIDKELEKALLETKNGDSVRISRPNELKRMILEQLLKGSKAKLVYLPSELVSYFAFDYDDYGMGKSLLESTKVYGSIRVMLMISDLLTSIRGAVPDTRLMITLDEDDPDKQATIDLAVNEFLNNTIRELKLNSFDVSDVMRSLAQQGIQIEVEGGEDWIKTRVEVDRTERKVARADTELADRLRRLQFAGLGFQPETADAVMSGELATAINARNALNEKMLMEKQQTFEEMLTNHAQRHIKMSGNLLDTIYEIIETKGKVDLDARQKKTRKQRRLEAAKKAVNKDGTINKGREYKVEITEEVHDIIDSISLTLPDPDQSAIRSQIEAYEEYSEAVDTIVEAYVTEDMEETLMEFGYGRVDDIRKMIAAAEKRRWIREQGFFPEFQTLMDLETDTELFRTINARHVDLANALMKAKRSRDKIKEKPNKEEEPPVQENPSTPPAGDEPPVDTPPTDPGNDEPDAPPSDEPPAF